MCISLLKQIVYFGNKKKKKIIKKIKQRKKQNVWKKTFDNPYRNIKSIFRKSKYVMYFVSKRLIYYLLTGKQKLLFISQKLSNLNEIYFSAKFLHVNITTKKKWQNRADYKSLRQIQYVNIVIQMVVYSKYFFRINNSGMNFNTCIWKLL